jgi:hypothetical protein
VSQRPCGAFGPDAGFAVLALLYAALVHQGMAPADAPDGGAWHVSRGFLLDAPGLAWLWQSTPFALACLALPAAALAAAAWLTGPSALARAAALGAGFAAPLFALYGQSAGARQVWKFFGWRGSAVLACTAAVLACACAAPWLAASWRRRAGWLRALLFLPVCLLVVAFLRDATGTDPGLPFRLSPWPAVAVFGLETGAFPTLAAIACAAVLLGLATWLASRRRPEALIERAGHLALGAALVALPIVVGQLWTRWDYHLTREDRARRIIDAAERHRVDHAVYPDELDELVAGGYLDSLPRPAIGFGWFREARFGYRGFGTSYLLEFPAPRWVECAYTPPYEDEEEDGETLEESWSCPSSPPELW